MKKKLLALALLVCLSPVVLGQGTVPTGGITKCPPDTICPQGATAPEPEESWLIDLLTFVFTII